MSQSTLSMLAYSAHGSLTYATWYQLEIPLGYLKTCRCMYAMTEGRISLSFTLLGRGTTTTQVTTFVFLSNNCPHGVSWGYNKEHYNHCWRRGTATLGYLKKWSKGTSLHSYEQFPFILTCVLYDSYCPSYVHFLLYLWCCVTYTVLVCHENPIKQSTVNPTCCFQKHEILKIKKKYYKSGKLCVEFFFHT